MPILWFFDPLSRLYFSLQLLDAFLSQSSAITIKMSSENGNNVTGKEKGDTGAINEKEPFDRLEGRADETIVLKDGVRTHPQPTTDPLDPLNWSSAKKHTILVIVMYM